MLSRYRLGLVDLPGDIHKLIIHELSTREPLFAPQYGVAPEGSDYTDNYGNLTDKSREYHGEWTDCDEAGAMGLLNWSMTCRRFRQLIAPVLYKTTVLRPTDRSLQSVRYLSQSFQWTHVSNLTYAGIWDTEDDLDSAEDWEGDTDEEIEANIKSTKWVTVHMETLTQILSNLPPNLKTLTLDFPQAWSVQDYDEENLQESHFYDPGSEDELRQLEKTDRYRAQLKTVLTAIGAASNIASLATKPFLELRLLNITPIKTTAYSSAKFKGFLNHVTKFELGLCHYTNNMGRGMNSLLPGPSLFAERLSKFFVNHLNKCTDFALCADKTWPLGLAPGHRHMKLSLPRTAERLAKIEKLHLTHCCIDHTVIEFLTSHLATLTSITLTDCFANGSQSSSRVINAPMWYDLFDRIVSADSPSAFHLVYFSVTNPSSKLSDLIVNGYPESLEAEQKQVRHDLELQRAAEVMRSQKDERRGLTDHKPASRKRVYSHIGLNDEYGDIFQDAERNVRRFLAGKDHKGWLKLVALMEENMRRLDKKYEKEKEENKFGS